jgi:glutamate-ammonia-ligase adenylyltransferase
LNLKQSAAITPDPIRAERNLDRLKESHEGLLPFTGKIHLVASLFSHSQFLSNYSINIPQTLHLALDARGSAHTLEFIKARASEELDLPPGVPQEEAMRRLRHFKKQYMMSITLRDLEGISGTMGAAEELSNLADVVIQYALGWCIETAKARYGLPEGKCRISLIGLGKLGGSELNYSSDVDLIAVYDEGQGDTEGVLSPTGIITNRVTNHEFYCTVVNLLTKLLSFATDDGIGYRVDLRLRPEGQKGEIAWPLGSYRRYYESWGRTWERMVLIRARAVAGDEELGAEFIKMVEPFVWRHTVDYSELEDIRAMKKKIDSIVTRDDIKRGYGGIREAEFFVQTFQILYGAENPALKTPSLKNALEAIGKMGLVPEEELNALWEAYVFYRRVEHYLQMADDLQTYILPSAKAEREVLARKMGLKDNDTFTSELLMRRMRVKNMYNSLLGTDEDKHAEALTLLEGSLNDLEMAGYLTFRGVDDTDVAVKTLRRIRDRVASPLGPDERLLVRQSVPELIELALVSEFPDRALQGLEGFLGSYGMKGAYLRSIHDQKPMAEGLVKLFALSPVLTRLLLSSQDCMNWLVEEMPIKKSRKKVFEEVERLLASHSDVVEQLGKFKGVEWLRLGMFFLSGIMPVSDLQRSLSHLAAVTLAAALKDAGGQGEPFSVIALGKFGGREITFGSDLDIVFVSESDEGVRIAERIVKTITSYTSRGVLYEVDTRLRPDGSKGSLVKTLEGYRKYYMEKAQVWEAQALVRARPVAGDMELGRRFLKMSRSVLVERGHELKREDIRSMRERILSELAREQTGYDVKLGPGGLEEIEFHVQWMQLQGARENNGLVIQNTPAAIRRLANRGDILKEDAARLIRAYDFFRPLQSLLWLNGEKVLTLGSKMGHLAAKFMGFKDDNEFFSEFEAHRKKVLDIVEKV